MSIDLQRQLHDYATFLHSMLPTFEADEVIAAKAETASAFLREPRRARRGWTVGLAVGLAVLLVVGGVAAVSALLGYSSEDAASGPNPLVVVSRYYEAYNARNGAALADLFADDIVLSFRPEGFAPSYVGKEEVLSEQLAEITSPDGPLITLSNPVVEGNTVRADHSFEVPGHVLKGTVEVVVGEGKITRITITLEEESLQEFQRG